MGIYASEPDQRRALARLASQSVPIMLVDTERAEAPFTRTYPLLARHIVEHYREAGTIAAGAVRLSVFVEAAQQPRRMDAHLGLPCFQ